MLKKLWLVLAASAVLAAGQVSATESEITQEEAEHVVAGATQEEITEATEIAKEIIAGRATLHDLAAIEKLQTKRSEKKQWIKKALLVIAVLVVVGGGTWFVLNKLGKSTPPTPPTGGGTPDNSGANDTGKKPSTAPLLETDSNL